MLSDHRAMINKLSNIALEGAAKLQAVSPVSAGDPLDAWFLMKGGKAKMTDTDIPEKLIRLIEKWMNNKKTGSLQINFIRGEINNVFENRAISLENNENQV